jgi:predicted ATPase/DNA-binding XRE family transcriptional regulator
LFGEEVRRLRLGAGLSQADLAERAGISERAVSDIERGLRATVYAATARSLADALAVAADQRREFLLAAAGQRSARVGAATMGQPAPRRYRAMLPVPLTALLGRGADLVAFDQMLTNDGVRLVTLIGPGGVGKTRLAIEVALRWREGTGGDVHFIDLSPVRETALVLPAIAVQLGVAMDAGDPLPQLTSRLAERPSLLILDTMEHVLDAAPAVATLATAVPAVKLLITSRAALKVRGEHQWPVQPLAVVAPPHRDDHARSRTGDVDMDNGGLGSLGPAQQLFMERAREADPHFPGDPQTLELAAAICGRLDGLPLAIELAAARVDHMSVHTLLRSLDDRLAPLAEGHRDTPARHHTMRAAIEWSYTLLTDTERSVLRALSVFRGGATTEAVDVVIGDAVELAAGAPQAAGHDALTVVGALVSASLVVADTAHAATRFRLLDLVAAYADELAGTRGEREKLRQAHAQYFLSLAQRAEPEFRGREQQEWFTRLIADESNLRAAMSWAIETRDATMALQLAGALWMFWRWAGLFADARDWLDAALALGDRGSPLRLPVLWGAGWLAMHHGDYARTAECGTEMLGLARTSDGALARRNALTLVGTAAMAMRQQDDAVASLREALVLAERTTDAWVRATSRLNLGTALAACGSTDGAIRFCEEALALYESIGDRHFAARAQLQLGYAHLRRGDVAMATSCVEPALHTISDLGDLWSIAEGLEAIAALVAETQAEQAAMLAAAADQVRARIGMRAHPADVRVISAQVEKARSSLGDAAFIAASRRGRDGSTAEMMELALTLVSASPERRSALS